uniref:Uncharacterized protein n=1 Tax=Glossina pallidipes TaxID=7398 RepID=A0A1A9ZE53_GLOPL
MTGGVLKSTGLQQIENVQVFSMTDQTKKKEEVLLSFPRNLSVTVDLQSYSKSTGMSSNIITHLVSGHLTLDKLILGDFFNKRRRISCIHIIERLQTLRSKLT